MNFDIKQSNKTLVVEMLKHEQILRYSQKYQDMYDAGFNRHGNSEYIERCMQRETLNHFGYADNDNSIRNYQMIGNHYYDDIDVKNAIQYLRINIMKECPLKILDNYDNTSLFSLDKKLCKLSEVLDTEKPNVIIAGSIT
jgi:hypothetical protein